MKPDIEKYLPYLDHLDLSDEKKIELIHSVWHICEAFVDQAWGLSPMQQIDFKSDKLKFTKPKKGKSAKSALRGLYLPEEDSEPLSQDELDQLYASCGMRI